MASRYKGGAVYGDPVLSALVVDAYFDTLAHAYARENPSQSGELNGFGAGLPGFNQACESDSRFRPAPAAACGAAPQRVQPAISCRSQLHFT